MPALSVSPAPLDRDEERSWLRRLGVALVAATTVLVPLAFDPFASVAFALPKASASRALLYLLLLTTVTYVAVHRGRPLRWSRIYVVLIALIAVYAAATVTAVHEPTALFGAPGRYLGLVTLVDNAALAVAVGIFVRTRREFLLVGTAALAVAVIALVYALAQATDHDPIPWGQAGRVFSTFGNVGPFSIYLLTIAAGVAAYLVVGRDADGWYRPSDRVGIALGTFCAACVAIIVLRGSRISELSLVPIAGVLAILAYRRYAARFAPARRRLVVSAALLVAMFAALAAVATPLGARVARLATEGDASITERLVIYRAGAEMMRARPVLGVGPDNFAAVYPTVREPAPVASGVFAENSAHSWVLKTATDSGLLGLAVFLVLVAWVLVRGWRASGQKGREIEAIAAVMIVAFLAQGVVSVSDISTEWLLWLAVGLIATPPVIGPAGEVATTADRLGKKRGRARARRARANVDRAYALIALVAGLLVSSSVLNTVTSSRLSKVSLHAVDLNDGGTAVAAALEAVGRDGGRGEPWNALGVSYDFVGRTDQAISAFRRAVAVEPYTRVYLTNLAEEEFKLVSAGHPESAELALRDARAALELAPTDPYTHYSYARMLNTLGGHEAEALAQADRAAQLAPGDRTYLALAATAHERDGDLAGAIERQRQVVAVGTDAVSRARLAHLYLNSGNIEMARLVVVAPRVSAVDRGCTPPGPCFRIVFLSDDQMQVDPARSDSVLLPGNYTIDGQPLPPSTTLTYDPSVSELPVVVVRMPAGGTSPRADATLTVTRVANSLGFAIDPNPTTTVLR